MSIRFSSTPLAGALISTGRFGEWRVNSRGEDYQHGGIDLRCSTNTKVFAVADGVATVRKGPAAGLHVVINHENFQTKYSHLNQAVYVPSAAVVGSADIASSNFKNEGDTFRVKAGDVIGLSGGEVGHPNAGASQGPHLHFELRRAVESLAARSGTLSTTYSAKTEDPTPYLTQVNGQEISFRGNETVRGGGIPFGQISVFRQGQRPTVITDKTPAISPFIASLDSFHPNIQYELTKRSYATETVQSHMPFVKLTSLSKVLNKHLGGGGTDGVNQNVYCPTLGPHGKQSVSFEDIYSPLSGRSLIGYATKDDNGKFISTPVVVEEGSDQTDAPNIPMAGIVSMTTERSTAGPMGVRGGLFKANIKIVAHSVGQLNALLVYFLRPATRVILEFGRRSSNPDETITPFNWNRSLNDISSELKGLVTAKKDQREFIKYYVYGNTGNYDIFIGYVVNFKLNYTGKNTYEIDLTVHSIQQFEVPVKLTGAQSLCSTSPAYLDNCKVMDITAYFNPDENWRYNSFDTLLSRTVNADINKDKEKKLFDYKEHVIKLLGDAADASSGYLISWQYFTDIVLNNEDYGLPSVFQLLDDAEDTKALLARSTLAPFTSSVLEINEDKVVNAQVSWHKSLRSTDPSTMIIYNPQATNALSDAELLARLQSTNPNASSGASSNTRVSAPITGSQQVGPFVPLVNSSSDADIGSLYNGVWINTNAIKEAFGSADTITSAFSRLLSKMNAATEGFWNLQLISDDTTSPGVHIIDAGLSKQVDKVVREDTPSKPVFSNTVKDFAFSDAEPDKPRFLYQFNRKLRRFNSDDIGSELLDIKLEAALPQVIAVQAIAGVGGVAQSGTWEAIRIDELKEIALFKEIYPDCKKLEETTAAQNVRAAETCEPSPTAGRLQQLQSEQAKIDSLVTDYNVAASGAAGGAAIAALATSLRNRNEVADLQSRLNPTIAALSKNYLNSFGRALLLVEYDKTKMMKELTSNVESSARHPFNSSNLTKTTVDLTLPGIGGIDLFQAFTVARVPNILDRGYYIVTKVNHEFSTDRGWITKIQGRFRYKPATKAQPPAAVARVSETEQERAARESFEASDRLDLMLSPEATAPATGTSPAQQPPAQVRPTDARTSSRAGAPAQPVQQSDAARRAAVRQKRNALRGQIAETKAELRKLNKGKLGNQNASRRADLQEQLTAFENLFSQTRY